MGTGSLTPEKKVDPREFVCNNLNGITTETFQYQLAKSDYDKLLY